MNASADIKLHITKSIETALGELHKHDIFLLEKDVAERALTHRLAVYLENKFPDWHIDCEYNRQDEGHNSKKLQAFIQENQEKEKERNANGDGSYVFPDIIIHKRGEKGPKNNLLVIEAKKNTANPKQIHLDKEKLSLYKDEIEYQFAILVTFNVKKSYNTRSAFDFI